MMFLTAAESLMGQGILELNSSFKGVEFYTENFSVAYGAGMRTKSAPSPGWVRLLRERLDALGWSVAELARRMDRGDDPVFLDRLYKYVGGKVKNPRGEMLEEIAAAVGLTGAELRYGTPDDAAAPVTDNVHRIRGESKIRTLGEVAANVWRDTGMADQAEYDRDDEFLFPPDNRFPVDAQYDLIVRGTSINRVAQDGYRLRVVDLARAKIDPPDGELVIVKRSRDDGTIVETTAKRIRYRASGPELWPDSDDPQWQEPLRLGDDPARETVQVIGLVLYAYRATRPRR